MLREQSHIHETPLWCVMPILSEPMKLLSAQQLKSCYIAEISSPHCTICRGAPQRQNRWISKCCSLLMIVIHGKLLNSDEIV
jgi:hypothetical protein